MRTWIMVRRLSQAFFFALFVYILWSTTYPLHGSLPSDLFFKINPSVMLFTALAERILLPGLIFSILMLLATLVLGRFFCGWICPLGATLDGVRIFKKTKLTGPGLGDSTNRKLRWIKIFVTGVIFTLALGGIQAAWVLDPMAIMARFVSLNLIPTATVGLDRFFMFLVRDLHLTGAVYDFYRQLKNSLLGITPYYFSSSFYIFLFFLVIAGAALVLPRLWCRTLCPLGAVYGLTARFSWLERSVGKCIGCKICKKKCRMGAIHDDGNYTKGECILCMDCLYDCPQDVTRFTFSRVGKKQKKIPEEQSGPKLTRANFLFLSTTSLLSLSSVSWAAQFLKVKEKPQLKTFWKFQEGGVIRPPAALKESEFKERCVRCGNCMKVCITNGLQPTAMQSGVEGIWTPRLVPEIGYCEYECNLCGQVCPTGAIPALELEVKEKTKLGLAMVDRDICLAWAENKECLVCEEHCPIPDKAIKKVGKAGARRVRRPEVDANLCVGCGICQNKCPVSPMRAIRVAAIVKE